MRILLIDDDKDLCHLTQMALEKYGYEVLAFQDASVAIKDAQGCSPDLILIDFMLPGTNGAEVVKALKGLPQLKDTPIVFLTALVTPEESGIEQRGLNVGGLNYQMLGKPYEIEELLEIVRRHAR